MTTYTDVVTYSSIDLHLTNDKCIYAILPLRRTVSEVNTQRLNTPHPHLRNSDRDQIYSTEPGLV